MKSIQGIIWAAPLAIYTLAIPKCFDALAGSSVEAYWPRRISWGIAMGVGSLVLNPALELLVRSNARMLAYIIRPLTMPSALLGYHWSALRHRMARRKAAHQMDQLTKYEILLRSDRHLIESSADAGSEINREKLRLIGHALTIQREQKPLIEQKLAEVDAAQAKTRERFKDAREKHLLYLEVALAGESARDGGTSTEKQSTASEPGKPSSGRM
ncbi:hypothetical protein [Micromonospora sediminicola]|uniref:hypothetical protein n=1 Tax=Micromonospora sediminicola TaxID=946078 RepID=UPI00339F228A